MRSLTWRTESWPTRGTFRISRGARTHAHVVVVEVAERGHVGRGECVPYARYGESVEGVIDQIERAAPEIRRGAGPHDLLEVLPAGAARNALDCAVWDLAARVRAQPVWALLGLPAPAPVMSAFTLGLDGVEAMAAAARRHSARPLLKVKLDRELVRERVAAVRAAAPGSRLIVDANEAWTIDDLRAWLPCLREHGVEMVEQPLPAADDHALAAFTREVAVAADESCHSATDVGKLVGRYDAINIKLDKTGGLTAACELLRTARSHGMRIMVGCMVGTSLGIAPALLLSHAADWVDLDGPLLLANDREGGVGDVDGMLQPPQAGFWGDAA